MSQTQTTTQQQNPVSMTALDPQQQQMLLKRLEEYTRLKTEADRIESALRKLRHDVEHLFSDAGATGLLIEGAEINGFKVKLITPTRTEIDKKKLLELGINLREVEVTKPGTPYVRVTKPGAAEREY